MSDECRGLGLAPQLIATCARSMRDTESPRDPGRFNGVMMVVSDRSRGSNLCRFPVAMSVPFPAIHADR